MLKWICQQLTMIHVSKTSDLLAFCFLKPLSVIYLGSHRLYLFIGIHIQKKENFYS